jgi:hypothetical protein
VHLDDGRDDGSDRVAQGDGGVRQPAGVDDDAAGLVGVRPVQAVDEGPRPVGLKKRERHVGKRRAQVVFDLGKGGATVNARLAFPQQVQVRPVENRQLTVHG